MASVFGWVRTEEDSFLLNKREILRATLECEEIEPNKIEYRFLIALKSGKVYRTATRPAESDVEAEARLERWLALPEDNISTISMLIEDGACRQ